MVIPPHGTSLPEQWMLGVSPNSASMAAKHQCNFCVSFMHPGSDYNRNMDILKNFRESYYQQHGTLPVTAVLTPCVVSEDDERIRRYGDQYYNCKDANIFGCKNYVHDKLMEMAEKMDADEIILFNPEWNREIRLESYQQIGEYEVV